MSPLDGLGRQLRSVDASCRQQRADVVCDFADARPATESRSESGTSLQSMCLIHHFESNCGPPGHCFSTGTKAGSSSPTRSVWTNCSTATVVMVLLVEYAIMLFNGSGVAKDETAAARIFMKAARRGSAIAQNRLANILSVGRGLPADPVEAIKWHLVSKAGGATDLRLDDFAQKQPPDVRAAAEKAAKPYLAAIAAARS